MGEGGEKEERDRERERKKLREFEAASPEALPTASMYQRITLNPLSSWLYFSHAGKDRNMPPLS